MTAPAPAAGHGESTLRPPEDCPDGTFGHSRMPAGEHARRWTPDAQTEHRAQLLAALEGFCVGVALHRARPRDAP
ncbi:hypothetical protein [Streptomyces aureocirculatus]|uniref:hypothetical protein n=1 Tax=Streptomyces aureocirculatus TaxID=67275 RepID=UPI000AFFEE72|nr:hypothetical protein [Streptomyces aureocirculatus]